ncbi:MAG: DUF502 domain-containing protein [Candidatus Competibacteraceae bacterium]|nr:DUF502 domain-containing protein [Candidatus Competibacteraceae bacterium]
MPASKPHHKLPPHAQRYLITGILTIIPIWITWLVFEIVLRQLTRAGKPGVWALSRAIRDDLPILSDLLLETWFQNVLAALITMIALYLLGWAATRVLGRRLIAHFDTLIGRVPGVQTVYGAVRKLIQSFQQGSEQTPQRVVLIEFPSPGMKTLGFITRVLQDQATGEPLAVVYVPTAPNPTSGYLEIVPLAAVTVVDWTMDEAMTFVLSGGAVSPDRIDFSGKAVQEVAKDAELRSSATEPAEA